MPKQMAMVDYARCQPEACEQGVCLAALACPRQVLTQEATFEMPDVHPSVCVGCALCVQSCPLGAVLML